MRRLLTGQQGWLGRVPSTLLLATICSGAVVAHHSFSGIYDTGQTLALTGTVREFLFIHPHPFLVVEVRNATGERQTWRAEMDNRFELEDIGVTADTFSPGELVIVSGSPGRSQPNILYLWKLERPADGLRYQQIGGTPSLIRAPR
jgi:hypothetical protein